MKFIFVDAENVGLNVVAEVKASLCDKVYVFSKNLQIVELSERKLFQVFSSYPTGANQADFYIIGNLVGVLASLSDEQKKQCQFVLFSQDNSLIMAFKFQCHLHRVACGIPLPSKSQELVDNKLELSIHQRLLQQFQHPKSTEDARKRLSLPKSDFTRALNELIKEKKIKRIPESQKKWVKVN